MKKIAVFGMLAAAGLLLATSCQNDELTPAVQSGEEVDVTFNLVQSGISTRAYSNGQTATTLTYAVYDADLDDITYLIGETKTDAFTDLTATVSLRLVTGKSYNVIFWADAPNSPYTFNAEANQETSAAAQTVTVDYTGVTSQDETRDAFYAHVSLEKVNGAINQKVELKRPFAQLNIGTTDYAESSKMGFTPTYTAVKVSNVYSTLNLLTDEVEEATSVTFASAAIPEGEDFPVDDVTYLAMDYLLVDSAKALVDVEFTVDNTDNANGEAEKEIVSDYTNVPVQRNYRTNIYGALLTNPADFTITIIPEYETPDYDNQIWDGETITEVTPDETDGIYYINNASELAWVAYQTQGIETKATSYNTFSGKTVKLNSDIYLNNQPWTTIGGNVTIHSSNTFAGTFDGNGHTIYDLNVTDQSTSWASAGLFGSTTGTIKNVTVSNAKVTSSHYAGAIVGYVSAGSEISNCHVVDATITSSPEYVNSGWDNGDKVGGIAGYANAINITGCTVKNSTITGYRDLGGIVGYFSGSSATLSGCSIENVTININTEHNYKGYTTFSEYDAGSIVGEQGSTATVSDCSGTATIAYSGDTTDSIAVVEDVTALNSALTDNTTAVVCLSDDFDLSDASVSTLSISTDKEIDLNGNSLTVSKIEVAESKSLTITDGDLNTAISSGDYVAVTLDNVNLTTTTSNMAIQLGDATNRKGGNTLTISNSTIDATGNTSGNGIVIQGQAPTVIIENTTISHNYFGITQNGSVAGSTITLNDVTISGKYSAVYLSNKTGGNANTLTISKGSFHSEAESAIEVKKTNLTIDKATLSSAATSQSYSVNAGGSNGVGYGLVLAGYKSGQAYDNDEGLTLSLSNITYKLAAYSSSSSDVIRAGKYDGSSLVEVDGSATLTTYSAE